MNPLKFAWANHIVELETKLHKAERALNSFASDNPKRSGIERQLEILNEDLKWARSRYDEGGSERA